MPEKEPLETNIEQITRSIDEAKERCQQILKKYNTADMETQYDSRASDVTILVKILLALIKTAEAYRNSLQAITDMLKEKEGNKGKDDPE